MINEEELFIPYMVQSSRDFYKARTLIFMVIYLENDDVQRKKLLNITVAKTNLNICILFCNLI